MVPKRVAAMTHLRIEDNTRVDQKKFHKVSRLAEKIANKTLGCLANEGILVFPEQIKEAQDITREQMILESINHQYRSGNLMGFLGYEQERLLIGSRFSISDKQDYFFQYLLERVVDCPNLLELYTDTNHERRSVDWFSFMFPYYLKRAMRKGLYKTYLRNRYNDENVKGSIDIPRHIAENTPFAGRIAYNRREFSYDNDLMELIRHTIECIKRKPHGKKLLQKVKTEAAAVVGETASYAYYDRQRVVLANKSTPLRHAYYREYRELQRLCIMILQQENRQIGSGTNRVYGVLFDGAWLWEEYVNLLIGEQFHHPMNKSRKDKQYLFAGNRGLIYPDFIGRAAENRVIADAKYKPFGNISGSDYQQLLAYMLRFESKKGYFLYPKSRNDKDDSVELKLNRGATYENNVVPRADVSVFKLGLKIPDDAGDYADFAEKMKISESLFKDSI